MKLISYLVLVLSMAMVAATVDAVPDSPAANARANKSSTGDSRPVSKNQPTRCAIPTKQALRKQSVNSAAISEPMLSAGYATDTSPPSA